MKGLTVPPDKLIQRLVRSAILTGHTDEEINRIIENYTPKWCNDVVNRIDERV